MMVKIATDRECFDNGVLFHFLILCLISNELLFNCPYKKEHNSPVHFKKTQITSKQITTLQSKTKLLNMILF